jgi:hypothetical protein
VRGDGPTCDPARVILFSQSLLSKWGFNDGDAPDRWFDWCDERGIDWTVVAHWRNGILPVLVRRFLLPAIDQDVTLVKIGTNHNPIRAGTVGGADVSDFWYGDADGPVLTPEYVEVPFETVLEIAMQTAEAGSRAGLEPASP